jgi:hypothetical protein
MTLTEIYASIRHALDTSPRNGWTAELHLQIIKHAEAFTHVTGREFCEGVRINYPYATEFSKMVRIAPRLRAAGLDPEKI